MLYDPLVLAGGLHALASLENVVAARLLHVDIFARLAGPDRRQRVPVIRRRDGDGVDVLVFEHLVNIDVRLHFATVLLLDGLGLVAQNLAVNVAEGHEPHSLHVPERTDVRAAPAVDPDDGYPDLIVSPPYPGHRSGHG